MFIILVGNTGTGKSRYATSVESERRIVINTDEFVEDYDVFSDADEAIFEIMQRNLSRGRTVILDGTSLDRRTRSVYLSHARESNATAIIIDFGPGDEITLASRLRNPGDTSVEEWTRIHQNNMARYQRPDESEQYDRIFRKHTL